MPPRTKAKSESHKESKKFVKKRRFECAECGKCYKNKQVLRQHKNSHTEKYKCDKCGKCHNGTSQLLAHRLIHTEKPFGCRKCDYRTGYKCDLIRHEKTCKINRRLPKAMHHPVENKESTDPARLEKPRPVQIHCQSSEEYDDYMGDYRSLEPDDFDPGVGETGPGGQETNELHQNKTFESMPEKLEEFFDWLPIKKVSGPEIEDLESQNSLREQSLVDQPTKLNENQIEEVRKFPAEFEELKKELFEALKKELILLQSTHKKQRRLIQKESDSSDDELCEKTPEKNRLQARRTRNQRNKSGEKTRFDARMARRGRKKRIRRKKAEKEPEDAKEVDPITQDDFGLEIRCAWCWCMDHLSDDCRKKTCLEERIFYKRRGFLCDHCLIFHPGRICFETPACPYCPEKDHHPAICPLDAHRQFLAQLS